MSFTGTIGSGFGKVLSALVRWLTLSGIHPNVLTLIGLVVNGAAAWILARGEFLYGGLIILSAAIFDLTDGAVARSANKVTRFGAFLDSVMDRYSDLILLTGLLVHYARIERFSYIVLTAVVMTGTVLVSYSRARAENLIPQCKVGFMERPERIVLLIIGALFNRMAPVLWVMAVLSNLTVVHRIVHTWRESRKRAEVEASDPVAAAETGTSGQAELHEGYRSV
ncbi:MAG: CDP-alcohol phosphatidyltransferase family protein [Acidobacteriia bacterium]|nr:CDP-alcohol phosphatidyltransferase family protein [Terriglobia bacterium]MYC68266.1 CDP-alcohol phosphatidyltransferase family protein [Terriglobia bacterium]